MAILIQAFCKTHSDFHMEKTDTYESALNFWAILLIFVSNQITFSGFEKSAKHQTKVKPAQYLTVMTNMF